MRTPKEYAEKEWREGRAPRFRFEHGMVGTVWLYDSDGRMLDNTHYMGEHAARKAAEGFSKRALKKVEREEAIKS